MTIVTRRLVLTRLPGSRLDAMRGVLARLLDVGANRRERGDALFVREGVALVCDSGWE